MDNMKNLKGLVALVVAMIMVLALCGSALADTNNLTKDASVTVTNLDAGDSVVFVKLIKWVDSTGWAWADGVETAAATAPALTLPTLTTITGSIDTSTTPATVTPGAISAANGAILGQVATRMKATAGQDGTLSSSSPYSATLTLATTDNSNLGLYCALITPGTPDYLYNPVFVSADFSQADTSPNSQAATLAASYSDSALVKKEQVTLTKEINGTDGLTGDTKYDVNVGDTVSFTITSKVPAFSDAYVDPVYVITDTLEKGLEVTGTPVVTIAGGTFAATTDYVVDVAADAKSFTVTLTQTGLDKVSATGTAQTITVTYSATVKAIDNEKWNVNEKDNSATVKFSNNPSDTTKYSLLEDKTRNYTFTIDGRVLGYETGDWETNELIKVGLNPDGSLMTQTINYRNGTNTTELSPLQGAHFTLYKADGTTVYTNNKNGTPVSYADFTSDGNGRLFISGLDCGTYVLKETAAPDGFIKDNREYTITIAANYKTIPGGTYENDEHITVKYNAYEVLDSYTVTVYDGTNTVVSRYAVQDANNTPIASITAGANVKVNKTVVTTGGVVGDQITGIYNTQGTPLPSTGGIGTTIFYIVGIVMVLGAAAVMVARRKSEQE